MKFCGGIMIGIFSLLISAIRDQNYRIILKNFPNQEEEYEKLSRILFTTHQDKEQIFCVK